MAALLTEAVDPASPPYRWSGDAIFPPGDLPRQGRIALWGTGAGTGKIELVFAGGTHGVRKRFVTATSGNHVTAGRLQLRLGRDLLRYPYAHAGGDWEPAGPPQPDPAHAIDLL